MRSSSVVILCLILAGVAHGADVEVGKPAPELRNAKTLDGERVRIADFEGKILLLDFWATWCGPCLFQLPNVYETYQKYHEDGLEILGISLDPNVLKLKSFVSRYEIPWPQVCDGKAWDSPHADLYGVHGIPHTVLIDRKGIVRAVDPHGQELEGLVTGLLDIPRRPFSTNSIVRWSPEVPPATGEVQITYRPFRPEMKEASRVFMVWGVNFRQLPDASSWPKGSRIDADGNLRSPMTREDGTWTVTIPLKGGVSEIDLHFQSSKDESSAGHYQIETASGREYRERMEKAEEARQAKNWDRVRDLLQPVVEADDVAPHVLAEASALLAGAYLHMRQTDKIEPLIAAVRERGVFHPGWINEWAWQAAVADNPERGRLLVAEALAGLLVAEEPNPGVLDTYAWVLYRLAEYDRAATQQRKSIESGGDSAGFYYRYAAILAAAGRKDEARQAYQEGRELRQSRGAEEFRKEAEKRLGTGSE